MSDNPQRATFTQLTQSGGNSDNVITVHFNPESLDLTIENNLGEPQGEGDATKQYISQATSKLSLTLQFDSTHTGEDVRDTTRKFAALMGGVADEDASTASSGSTDEGPRRVPAIVRFDWGAFTFQGTIASYKEVIDFWSFEGVPLRANLALTLQKQDEVFADDNRNDGFTSNTQGAIELPRSSSGSVSDVAAQGGDPRAARALASANGLSSLRSGISGGLVVGGGASIGVSGGASVGGAIGVGAGVSVGAGLTTGGSASLGASFQASARSQAAGGAFSDLRSTSSTSLGRFKAQNVLTQRPEIGAGSTIAPGGRVVGSRTSGLSADVGVGRSLSDRIRFGEEA